MLSYVHIMTCLMTGSYLYIANCVPLEVINNLMISFSWDEGLLMAKASMPLPLLACTLEQLPPFTCFSLLTGQPSAFFDV